MTADIAIHGARIRTMDPANPWATSLAVHDGVVVAVGDQLDVRSHCDARTEIIDLGGAVITPGLVDGRQHLLIGAELARGVNFDRVPDLARVRQLLRSERHRIGPGSWLLGFALEYAAFGGAEYRHDLLDEAAGPGPMIVYSLDLHTAFVNRMALDLAGITGPMTFGDGSSVVCDGDGRPTGELRELAAMDTVRSHIPPPTDDERFAWYTDTIRGQNAVGITGLHLMDGNQSTIDSFAALDERGVLDVRVAVHQFVTAETTDDDVERILRQRDRRGSRWRADGVKFVMDGVIDTGTAWLEEPDLHGDGTDPLWPDLGRFRERIRSFHDAGFRIAAHAIGDRAVREVLDTFAALPGGSAQRHRIEHIETAPDSTVARFAPEGVAASMQPVHLRWLAPDLSDPWSQRLGPARCAHAMRSGDLSAAGAVVVLGSDWPVAPYDPRLGFFAAQQRRSHDVADPSPIGASRPLDGHEVLAGYTTNPARAVSEQDRAGMLRPGFQADLVAWEADPVTCPPSEVVDLPVRLTMVDGKVVHRLG